MAITTRGELVAKLKTLPVLCGLESSTHADGVTLYHISGVFVGAYDHGDPRDWGNMYRLYVSHLRSRGIGA